MKYDDEVWRGFRLGGILFGLPLIFLCVVMSPQWVGEWNSHPVDVNTYEFTVDGKDWTCHRTESMLIQAGQAHYIKTECGDWSYK